MFGPESPAEVSTIQKVLVKQMQATFVPGAGVMVRTYRTAMDPGFVNDAMLQLACNSLRREGAMVLLPTMVSTLSVGACGQGIRNNLKGN